MSDVFVHPTALVEAGVVLGPGTRVWDSCHLRAPSKIGRDCIIGEKTYVAYGVEIGDRVKLNAFVYVCTAVTLEQGVMISAGTVFTNDRFPRATTPDLSALASSEPDEKTLATVVREGATIGARCVIGPGLEIGRFAMVGMGAVVTRSVPAFHLVVGHPARTIGFVCRCGEPFARFREGEPPADLDGKCERCGRRYEALGGDVRELVDAAA
ncbi:MAG TPA: DapH/DapD/GlmU-related protein [Myxococcota bacterium]|nr:DapH/DapD/GlmU-related protein [Myxococcota bacterium]